ncbi:MAG: bifunctional diaminohydroxyphosphoribosylaminopyrimidine deaminase/5-amino-6-(5-phosphoribosylamino)uracil reductase RibD [Paucibacter sp.]|nr:bifunctional diaminohydroxyphosphoribosylaminopyrimidine deaminase/5-amino-6-(5-phosphoribosylamino)uracil reductase RibD [Roseateles sp.]
MRRALALAESAIGLTEPNPRVGCVIVNDQGEVIGSGHTQQAGGPHAEVMALRDAAARGADVRGATAYVTLEPCSHHGRTPPCCDALIAAGLKRVAAAVQDPNPQVAGQGLSRLACAGIEVSCGLLAEESRELNIGFFSRMQRGRPFVRMKIAASLDGRTALSDGRSQWITQEAARRDGHLFRKRAGAILTGIGTVREDDPRLDVRLVETPRQPLRVIIDSRLEISPSARILQPPGDVLVYSAGPLRAGIEVVALPGPGAKVDLGAALADLGRRGINELHVEAGHRLNGSLLREGLVDELLIYMAPMLIGPGRELAALPPLPGLDQASRWQWLDMTPVGPDLRLRARPL